MVASSLSELEDINFQDLLNEVPKDWTCHVNLPYWWLFQWEIPIFPKIKKKEKKRKKEKVEMPEKRREMILISLVPLNCPRFS